MLYFAYGSNMDWDRITHRDRAPSAQFLLRATLPDYKLAFTRWSKKQQTGTADVVLCPGKIVWGAVFEIDPTEQPKLDATEGVNFNAYRPETVTVLVENDSTRPLPVLTYVVCEKSTEYQPPASWYLDHIVKGAIRWELPGEYLAGIQRIATKLSSKKTIGHWKAIEPKLVSGASPGIWEDVLSDYYYDRLKTRYLDPIKAVQNLHFFKCRKPEGEGFAIAAIQCSLIEFLESCFQGIDYALKPILPYEYRNSGDLFVSFLTKRQPFDGAFNKALAKSFYESVRCGVLHEARTKGAWLIHTRRKNQPSLIVDSNGPTLYRDAFQEAIITFIADYSTMVPRDRGLQLAFISKFHHLCV